MPVIEDRWEKIKSLPLKSGAHDPDSTFCVMEAAAYVAGEEWSDHPRGVPRTIATVLRYWNDRLGTDADRDRLLKPFIPRIIDLRSDKATETRRAIMVWDWMLRTAVPKVLLAAHFDAEADRLAQRAECKTVDDVQSLVKDFLDRALDLARNLEESQLALVERMIACGKDD
jgi:hypothetical protein